MSRNLLVYSHSPANWNWISQKGGATRETVVYNGVKGVKFTRQSSSGAWECVSFTGLLRNGLNPNTKYMLSADIKQNKPSPFTVSVRNEDGTNPLIDFSGNNIAQTTEWTHFDVPLTALSEFPTIKSQVLYLKGFNTTEGSEVCIANACLYEGTTPQPYHPAPEDYTINLTNFEFEQGTLNENKPVGSPYTTTGVKYDGNLTGRIRSKELIPATGHVRIPIMQGYEMFYCEFNKSGYSGKYIGWISGLIDKDLSSDTSAIALAVRKTGGTAITSEESLIAAGGGTKMATLARSDTLTLKTLNVGGRNLLINSGVQHSGTAYNIATYDLAEKPKVGELYTLTIWGELGSDREFFAPYNSGGYVSLDREKDGKCGLIKIADGIYQCVIKWRNTSGSYTADDSKLCIFQFANSGTSSSTINHSKLEKCSIGTDWTPAPEDVTEALIDSESRIEQRLSSQITQTQQSIESKVSEQYYQKSETDKLISQLQTAFTQTSTGWQMNWETLTAIVNANKDDADKEFEEYSRFIRFVDGNIILGKSDNPITLTIKNDRISFAQNGQEVAYISNSVLHITDAEVSHSLKIGKFAFVPRSNGSLDFKKVG